MTLPKTTSLQEQQNLEKERQKKRNRTYCFARVFNQAPPSDAGKLQNRPLHHSIPPSNSRPAPAFPLPDSWSKNLKLKMGRKGRNNNAPGSQPHISMTMRDQSSGKKHGNVNAKTMCKLDHLKSIAVWASTEASMPSLGAFLGERLAATTEALGLRADPSFFVCERCETTLQPGSNCTVRIEKNKSKARRHKSKKSNLNTQNNVVYTCHFCSHRNLMRGTPKGYVKKICPPKAKPPLTTKSAVEKGPISTKATENIVDVNKMDADALSGVYGQIKLETTPPATPLVINGLSLLDSKMRKRNRSNAKKVAKPKTSLTEGRDEKSKQGSSKRRRKAWTSLKEIAQSGGNDNSKKLTDLTVPFFI